MTYFWHPNKLDWDINLIFLRPTLWLHFIDVISKLKIWTNSYSSIKTSHLIPWISCLNPTDIAFACDGKISMYVVYATNIKLEIMNWIVCQGGGFWLTLLWFHQIIFNFTLQFGKELWLGLGLLAYKSMYLKHFYVYLLCLQGKCFQCLSRMFSLNFVGCVFRINIVNVYLLCR